MSNRLRTWWQAPDGGKSVLLFSLPLVITTASWTLMHFVDRMFLLWHSQDAMAAALPAGMVSFVAMCFPLGVAAYANTFVAQYHGAGRPERIGRVVWQGAIVGLLATPLVMATISIAPQMFDWMGHEPEVRVLEVKYYQILCYGTFFWLISAALETFFTGRGLTRIVMVVNLLAITVNIALDYVWIFGYWGFPEWGIAGAAWATVVGQLFKMVLLLALMLRRADRAKYQTVAGCRFDGKLFRRLLRFGCPSGLQLLVDMTGITLFIVFVGQLGKPELTATNLAFNVSSFAFMPMLGMGMAASILVGQRLGSDRADLASRATWSACILGLVYMSVLAMVFLLVPEWLLLAHGAHADPKEFAELRDTTVVLLRFVAAYCILDAVNIIFAGAIKGAGDTKFIFRASIVMAIALVGSTWVAIKVLDGGLYGAWFAITGWVCLLGVIYLGRFLQGKWRTMRVIEPECLSGEDPLQEEPTPVVSGEAY